MGRLFSRAASSLIYGAKRLAGSGFPAGVRILTYHSVNDREHKSTTVPTAVFESHLRHLKDHGFRTVTLKQLVAGTPGEGACVVLSFDGGFIDLYENVFPLLKKYEMTASVFCIVDRIGEGHYLNKHHIREMKSFGIEFGSHTLSHPDLTGLTRAGKWNEIGDSKRIFEETLGFEIHYFCYPYGRYDRECLEIAEKAGYRGACTNRPGINQPKPFKTLSRSEISAKGRAGYSDRGGYNPFLLNRTGITSEDSLWDYRKKLAGAYDGWDRFFYRFRRRP